MYSNCERENIPTNELKAEFASELRKTKRELQDEIARKSENLTDLISYKINEHDLNKSMASNNSPPRPTNTLQPLPSDIKESVDAELLAGVEVAVDEEELRSVPVAEAGKVRRPDPAQVVTSEYFCEELESEAVRPEVNVEDLLINCLAPMQLARPARDYLTVENIDERNAGELAGEGAEEEEDAEDYMNRSYEREIAEEEERRTAAVMMKLIGLRTEELLKKADKVEHKFKKYDANLKKAEEDLQTEERRQMLEELRSRAAELKRQADEVSVSSMAEESVHEEPENTEELQHLMQTNEALMKEAGELINLRKSGKISASQLDKSLGPISDQMAESMCRDMQEQRKTSGAGATNAAKKVRFDESAAKGKTRTSTRKPPAKKGRDELQDLMHQAKVNKTMCEAFDEMAHLLDKHKIKA